MSVPPPAFAPPRWIHGVDPLHLAADALVEAVLRADGARRARGARVALSGGSALKVAQRAFGALPADVMARARVTYADERDVPFEHTDSNAGQAHALGLFARPPAVELRLTRHEHEPSDAWLARLGARFRATADAGGFDGGLDVCLLGLGEDGHIASLFPGLAWEGEGGATFVYVTRSPKSPAQRVTFARSALASCEAHVMFAQGDGKRHALARMRDADSALPAVGLRGLTVVTDVAMGAPTAAAGPGTNPQVARTPFR